MTFQNKSRVYIKEKQMWYIRKFETWSDQADWVGCQRFESDVRDFLDTSNNCMQFLFVSYFFGILIVSHNFVTRSQIGMEFSVSESFMYALYSHCWDYFWPGLTSDQFHFIRSYKLSHQELTIIYQKCMSTTQLKVTHTISTLTEEKGKGQRQIKCLN